MDLSKFTLKAQEIINSAFNKAMEKQHQYLRPEHVLSALIEDKGSIANTVFLKLGFNTKDLEKQIAEELNKIPSVEGANQNPYASAELNRVMAALPKISQEFGDEYIATEHILLALSKEKPLSVVI